MSEVYHAQQLPLFPTKVCSKCLIEKPLVPNRAYCRDCKQQYERNYYAAHREQMRQSRQKYEAAHREQACQRARDHYAANREQKKQYQRNYTSTHHEQINIMHRRYRVTHHEHHRQYLQEYQTTHREQIQQAQRAYYITHREQIQQWGYKYRASHHEQRRHINKIWRQANRHKRRELGRRRDARKRNATISTVNYEHILERDGMYCYICEQTILPHHILHFDHVIPLSRNGAHSEENIKPTHQQCNLRKGDRLLSEMTPFQRRGVA